MRAPPLFASHAPAVQLVLGLLVPSVGGAIGGILLGVSEPVYLVYSVIAIGAGYFGGMEHVGAGEGAQRGFAGGLLFGTLILAAHEVTGADAKAELPHPQVLLVVITTVLGVGLGALGGRARARRERERPAQA